MELSKKAIQLSINELHTKIDNQEKGIQEYKDQIEALREEKFSLRELSLEVKSGQNTDYESEALEKNIDRINISIGFFMKAIVDMEEQTTDYYRMIATLEVKRDTEGF